MQTVSPLISPIYARNQTIPVRYMSIEAIFYYSMVEAVTTYIQSANKVTGQVLGVSLTPTLSTLYTPTPTPSPATML